MNLVLAVNNHRPGRYLGPEPSPLRRAPRLERRRSRLHARGLLPRRARELSVATGETGREPARSVRQTLLRENGRVVIGRGDLGVARGPGGGAPGSA